MIRLAIRCRPEQAETILAELLELAPGGVEESRGDGYVEYAVYGPPGEIPMLPDVEAAAGEGLVSVETTEVPDDWADRWRDFHRPVVVGGGRMIVRPSWEAAAAGGAEIELVVDPGRAFGTGSHATTRGCLEEMLTLADAGEATGALLDWGTGSGVLAIAAATMGWGPVQGVDHEMPAVQIAAANAADNGVSVDFERLNLREQAPPAAPWVVANLTSPLLLELAGRMRAGSIDRPEHLLLSGILAGEEERVGAAFALAGFSRRRSRALNGWSVLLLDRDGS